MLCRWTNPTRGGNRSRDFSQTYVERVAGSFEAQAAELQRVHPALMQAAVAAWEAWHELATREAAQAQLTVCPSAPGAGAGGGGAASAGPAGAGGGGESAAGGGMTPRLVAEPAAVATSSSEGSEGSAAVFAPGSPFAR